MSRSGYSDDCENLGLYRQAVDRAMAGKRGQSFLHEMAASLDAMPVKELIANHVVTSDGAVCAIGAVALARRMDLSDLDVYDSRQVGERFGVSRSLAAEIAYENDEGGGYGRGTETPAERWTRMRAWVDEHLSPPSPAVIAKRMERLR